MASVQPLIKRLGDVKEPYLEKINDRLALITGDLGLSAFEDELSSQWSECLDRKERAFRVIFAFWRVLQKGAGNFRADLVLIDIGPNLGAINRAALVSADFVVVPLSPDPFSLQGLRNLGPTLEKWRSEWKERLEKSPSEEIPLPSGNMRPIGYVVLQHAVRLDRPVKSYEKWMARIPEVYREFVLNKSLAGQLSLDNDPNCLANLKHYRSLAPMAQEARKPIFHLTPADGAGGAHFTAAKRAGEDFKALARKIAEHTGILL